MKILNLKFKNINSLSSENEIDFTNPIFTDNGLFAITGKTGSGKTSILDAISLALYGRTARVEISGSGNAVITRGEKDCSAEIIFEVAGKKWKSSWKQAINRNGNLNPVQRQIASFDDTIVADQVKSCNTKIIDIIGLTFEQFTKVIMLAQGSFAAFLQADKNDKGQLLEQLTGTEIYAEISKKVFERNRLEKEKLEKIELELGAIKILSEEEIKNLENESKVIENDKKQVDEELKKIEIAKKWLLDLANLQNQINEVNKNLPELNEKVRAAEKSFDQSEKDLQIAKNEQIKYNDIFIQVRKLDTQIAEKEKLLKPISETLSKLNINIKNISAILKTQEVALENDKQSFKLKQNWAIENKKYEELVANYATIELENQLLISSFQKIQENNNKINELQKQLTLKQSNLEKSTNRFNEKNKDLITKKNELEIKKNELIKILGGKEFAELQKEKENITNFVLQLKQLVDIAKEIYTGKEIIKGINENIEQNESSREEFVKSIAMNQQKFIDIEKNINILDENIRLTKTIQSLEDHRKELKEGESCPLCGSKEHPYTAGNIPIMGEKEKELNDLKKQLKDESNLLQQNERNLATLEANHGNIINDKTKEEKKILDNITKQTQILKEIQTIRNTFSLPLEENRIKILNEMIVQERKRINEITPLIEEVTQIERQIINLRDKEIPSLQEDKDKTEKAKIDAETEKKLEEQRITHQQKLIKEGQEKYNTDKAIFLQKLEIYEVENIEALKNCLDNWKDNQQQTELLKTQINKIENDILLNKNNLESQTQLCNEKEKEHKKIEKDKGELTIERKRIFGEEVVDTKEKKINQLIKENEEKKIVAEKNKNELNIELEKSKAIVTTKEKELIILKEQKITERTKEELQMEFDEKKIKTNELSQKIGANNQKLKSNAESLKTVSSRIKEKEKQQAICNKWGKLNDLIGSKEGQTYRNFAQSLTFEHLINLANKQLKIMTDRYLLKRTGKISDKKEDNPFELSVIDSFQNNEERTAQNLSGGEKFIVSLSLALGLSKMASKNMRIDTLFIDEGFGTLDTDYLDVALSALSNLQSDGKIIGVISHVNELKERIATHIEVVSKGNGYSKIQIK